MHPIPNWTSLNTQERWEKLEALVRRRLLVVTAEKGVGRKKCSHAWRRIDVIIKKFRQTNLQSLDSCWPWVDFINRTGYGIFSLGSHNYTVSRFVLKSIYAYIPRHIEVCHTCDNPACFNPDHLFLANHAENMRDMFRKQRANRAFGERSGASKITELQASEIRNLHANTDLTTTQIGDMYGICRNSVSRIVHRSWKHVPHESPPKRKPKTSNFNRVHPKWKSSFNAIENIGKPGSAFAK